MKKTSLCLLLATSLIATTSCYAVSPSPSPTEVEAKFSKLLRNTKVSSVRQSPVNGLYEVIAGPNVIYYSPEGAGHLIFGQIVDSEGKNLTAEIQTKLKLEYQKNMEKVVTEKLKNLPLDLAVKIGNGPNVVIEFTDPDCPYCRKVDDFMSRRSDITRYVFLNPIEQLHPYAHAKSIFILNSKDQKQALHDVFAGKYDKGGLPISKAEFSKYPLEVKRLAEGMGWGQELGVQGTPMLFINGQMINGADMNRIKNLLDKP